MEEAIAILRELHAKHRLAGWDARRRGNMDYWATCELKMVALAEAIKALEAAK